jgi:hypothetical protein
MATITQTVNTRTSLTVTGIGTLASATYVASSTYTANTNKPLDVIVEVEAATTNTPAGNKQVVVFVQESLDGTNFRSGPTSGTTTTDEPNLRFLGTVPMNTASVTQRGTFSVAQALGYCPHSFKIVVKNDLGVALTSAAAYTSEISATSA